MSSGPPLIPSSIPPASPVSGVSSPGIARCSLIHAPRSIRRQRSLQNGRYGEVDDHSIGFGRSGMKNSHAADSGADDAQWRQAPACVSGAERQRERHVLGRLHGMRGGVLPEQEAHAAAVMAAADLRVESVPRGSTMRIICTGTSRSSVSVEYAAVRDFRARFCLLARHPEQFRDRVAERPDHGEPMREVGAAHLVGLVEPVRVVGQVELAGAARDRAAVLDRVQELRVAQLAA